VETARVEEEKYIIPQLCCDEDASNRCYSELVACSMCIILSGITCCVKTCYVITMQILLTVLKAAWINSGLTKRYSITTRLISMALVTAV